MQLKPPDIVPLYQAMRGINPICRLSITKSEKETPVLSPPEKVEPSLNQDEKILTGIGKGDFLRC